MKSVFELEMATAPIIVAVPRPDLDSPEERPIERESEGAGLAVRVEDTLASASLGEQRGFKQGKSVE